MYMIALRRYSTLKGSPTQSRLPDDRPLLLQRQVNPCVYCQEKIPKIVIKIPCFWKGNSLFLSGHDFIILRGRLAHQCMLHAIALAIEHNQMAMVDQAINHRSRHLLVRKYTTPF